MVKIVLEHRTKSQENTKKLVKLLREVRSVAKKQTGFIYGETLLDSEDPCHVIVVTNWRTEEDWKAWDCSPARAATRPQIEELLVVPFNAIVVPAPVVWREDIAYVF